jgi:hypothetical protein
MKTMKLLLVLLGMLTLTGCTETKVTPVCEYGGQISGNTVVCNPRFTPVPSAMAYSVGKIMFDNKTAQDCWAGDSKGRGPDAVSLPTCGSLGN